MPHHATSMSHDRMNFLPPLQGVGTCTCISRNACSQPVQCALPAVCLACQSSPQKTRAQRSRSTVRGFPDRTGGVFWRRKLITGAERCLAPLRCRRPGRMCLLRSRPPLPAPSRPLPTSPAHPQLGSSGAFSLTETGQRRYKCPCLRLPHPPAKACRVVRVCVQISYSTSPNGAPGRLPEALHRGLSQRHQDLRHRRRRLHCLAPGSTPQSRGPLCARGRLEGEVSAARPACPVPTRRCRPARATERCAPSPVPNNDAWICVLCPLPPSPAST